MSRRIRPSARKKTMHNVMCSALSETDKKCIEEVFEKFEQQKAEKEALIAGQETLQKALAEKNAEVERLYSIINEIGTGIANIEKILPDMRKEIKTEAIKELLDKIEKQAIPNEDDMYWVELDDIYNLVKEMVGDTK